MYVSGLPEDVTDDEFKELMNKCGMIMYDPRTQKMKLKLYRDADGKPKGDGLCCYIKVRERGIGLIKSVFKFRPRGIKYSCLGFITRKMGRSVGKVFYFEFFKNLKYPHTTQNYCQNCVQVPLPEKRVCQ